MQNESKSFKGGMNCAIRFSRLEKETKYSKINKCREVNFTFIIQERNTDSWTWSIFEIWSLEWSTKMVWMSILITWLTRNCWSFRKKSAQSARDSPRARFKNCLKELSSRLTPSNCVQCVITTQKLTSRWQYCLATTVSTQSV